MIFRRLSDASSNIKALTATVVSRNPKSIPKYLYDAAIIFRILHDGKKIIAIQAFQVTFTGSVFQNIVNLNRVFLSSVFVCAEVI